eukprot:Sspe_Gene.39145::Locus_18889_Transcript_1_1_Confidence_1.000_Length_1012::g.39145::m.39145
MEEWDDFLRPKSDGGQAPSPTPPAPTNGTKATSDGLEAFLGGPTKHEPKAPSPPPPATVDVFGCGDDFTTKNGRVHSPTPQRNMEDDLLSGFVGGGKPQNTQKTLADLKKEQDGFLMGNPSSKAPRGPDLMMQSHLNHYEILGVARNAGQDEIKRVYKKKSMELHPDRNPDLHDDDKQLFKLITKAHEVLVDPVQRHQYDMELAMQEQQPSAHAQGNWLFHLGRGQQQQPQPQMHHMQHSPPPMPSMMHPMGGQGFPFGTAPSPQAASPFTASPTPSPTQASPPPAAPKPASSDPFASLF